MTSGITSKRSSLTLMLRRVCTATTMLPARDVQKELGPTVVEVAFYFWQHFLTFVLGLSLCDWLGAFHTGTLAASWVGAVFSLRFNETICTQ